MLSSKLRRTAIAYRNFLVINTFAKAFVEGRDCLFQVFLGKVAIPHCHPQIFVSKKGLNRPQINPSHGQITSKVMPEVGETRTLNSIPRTSQKFLDKNQKEFKVLLNWEDGKHRKDSYEGNKPRASRG